MERKKNEFIKNTPHRNHRIWLRSCKEFLCKQAGLFCHQRKLPPGARGLEAGTARVIMGEKRAYKARKPGGGRKKLKPELWCREKSERADGKCCGALWGGMLPPIHCRCANSESNKSKKAAHHGWCVWIGSGGKGTGYLWGVSENTELS